MTTHALISLEAADLWRQKLGVVEHGFAYTWEHCYAMRLTTGLETYLYSFESGESQIVAPLCERSYQGHLDIVKPYGFSGFAGTRSCPRFAESFREFAQQRGYVCGYLGVDPLQGHDLGFDVSELPVHGTAHVLDITVSDEELFRNLSTVRRRQLRNWEEISSALVEDDEALCEVFLDHYVDFMRTKEAPSFYYFARETLAFLLAQDNVFVVGARDQDGVAAVSVFGHTSAVGEYLFNVPITKNGRHYAAALIWYGMKRLKAMGVPRFSLGGSYAQDGLYDFKRRFGGERLPLRHLKQVFDPRTFEDLCRSAGASTQEEGFFPPYRRGHRDGRPGSPSSSRADRPET